MWAVLLDMLKILIPAGLAIFAAMVGWRWQTVGKRRFELAEQLLVEFNLVADVLQNARLPISRGDEGSTRGRAINEQDEEIRLKDSYWVPVERINKSIGLFGEARKNELISKYFFGAEASQAFSTIKASTDKVVIASRMLIMTARRAGEPPESDEQIERTHNWQRDIWGTFDANDSIHCAINEARTKLEQALVPELQKGATLWPWPKTR